MKRTKRGEEEQLVHALLERQARGSEAISTGSDVGAFEDPNVVVRRQISENAHLPLEEIRFHKNGDEAPIRRGGTRCIGGHDSRRRRRRGQSSDDGRSRARRCRRRRGGSTAHNL